MARFARAGLWAGIRYRASIALFVVALLTFRLPQPVGGLLLAAVGVLIALRLPDASRARAR